MSGILIFAGAFSFFFGIIVGVMLAVAILTNLRKWEPDHDIDRSV